MNVTDRQKAYLQINEDAENVLEVINEFAGVPVSYTHLDVYKRQDRYGVADCDSRKEPEG